MDVLPVAIIGFVVFFAVVFTYMFLAQFQAAADSILPTAAKQAVQSGMDQFLIWDQGIILLIAGLWIVSLIGAAMINSHPIFFVATVMLLVCSIFVGATITNIFIEIAGNAEIASYANLFPLSIQFFQNLPLWLMVMTLSIGIVMFGFGGRNVSY